MVGTPISSLSLSILSPNGPAYTLSHNYPPRQPPSPPLPDQLGGCLHPSQTGRLVVCTAPPTITVQDPTYLVVYMFWMKIILVELGPYTSIAALNTALIIL